MLLNLPWLIIPLLIYNIIAFSFGGPSGAEGYDPSAVFQSEIFSIGMLSGVDWTLTLRDLILIITMLVLFVEIIKSTRTSSFALLDHGLSIVVFVICLVEFLIVPQATTSLFFLITIVAMIDVVAGFSIGIRAARRDLNLGTGGL